MAYIWDEIRQFILDRGAVIQGGINWTWAIFPDDEMGEACFTELLKRYPFIEHRGYYKADPQSSNSNLHRGGFRYR